MYSGVDMYIRKLIRSYNGRTYANYLVVESVHTQLDPIR
jgi:hypothetical protein